ncbi:hypothetical protein Trydic_g15412 [Trypoxylus dichotomus]
MTSRCDSNPAQYERNRRFGHLGGGRLCLNASKTVSFLVKGGNDTLRSFESRKAQNNVTLLGGRHTQMKRRGYTAGVAVTLLVCRGYTAGIAAANRLIEKLLKWTEGNGGSTSNIKRDWSQILQDSCSGNGLRQGSIDGVSGEWSGRDYIEAVLLRGNLLPTKDIPSNPPHERKCRAGCNKTESLSCVARLPAHILEQNTPARQNRWPAETNCGEQRVDS